MAPGGTLFRFTPYFGENVLPHGSHEWLPYSKDEVRLKTVNNNLSSCHFKKISNYACFLLIFRHFQGLRSFLPVHIKRAGKED